MPIWLYQVSPLKAAIVMILLAEMLSMVGLFLARRYLVPRFEYSDGINDAISGTVQAIGVFYGVTVGLIAVAVWNTNSNCADLVSNEAAAIGALYRDVSGYPEPERTQLRLHLREYTVYVIEKAWPAQMIGQTNPEGRQIIDNFQAALYSSSPTTPGQIALHGETLRAYNNLIEYRRLRMDAVNGGLSTVMWAVIWIGAGISVGIAYFFKVADWKLHAVLIGFVAGFLALVLFMIVVNDKPFYGPMSVSSEPYQIILDTLIDKSK
jgi:hypothetical protein